MATKTKTINLTVLVQDGDFNIVSMDTLQVKAGENVGFSVSVDPLLGFAKPVTFSIDGGPAGMTTTWQTGNIWNPGSGNLVCVLAVPLNNALAGTYQITLTGTA